MIISGEVVSGYAANAQHVSELINDLKARD